MRDAILRTDARMLMGRLNQPPHFFAATAAALIHHRFERTLQSAPTMAIDDSKPLILFSDCHRGDGGLLDRFALNQSLFTHALDYYDARAFTYIEVGDGDEMWQVDRFSDILHAHAPVFARLRRLRDSDRLHLIVGNHDIGRDRRVARQKLGLPLHHGLRLQHTASNRELFVTHGHQADWQSVYLSRMLFRNIAKPFQQLALQSAETNNRMRRWLRDLTHAIEAKYEDRISTLEARITRWATAHRDIWLICGHTHQPRFAQGNVFNTGSCLQPNVLEGLEIQHGHIAQIRWTQINGTIQRHLLQRTPFIMSAHA